jgi:S-adenosylmethionine-diacylgycerolhomoserine-N-methlytransferase
VTTSTAAATDAMNRLYRHQRHVYNLTRRHYLLGRDLLIARLDPPYQGTVLEIGCGTGRNLIVAARRYPGARFFGIDVSTEMLTSAIDSIARAGLSARVRVAHADATRTIPVGLFGTNELDRIFVSYSLSIIPAWKEALDVALSHLKPGGELHIVDFGGQEGLPGWFRAGLRRWLALFHVTPRDTLEPELMTRARRLELGVTFERPYRGYSQYALLRRAT